MKKALSQSTFLFVVILITSLLNVNMAFAQATLTSDQNDYAPGATATLTGSGFLPDETVKLLVVHASYVDGDPIGDDHVPWFVTADSEGNFVTTWHVCEDDCIGETLKAMADGESSLFHAEVLFTDANSALTKPTPTTAAYGSTVTLTSRLTQSGGAGNGNPVPGRNVTYTISGLAAGSGVTDSNGVSTASSTVALPVGSYAPIVVFGVYLGGGVRANWGGDAAFSTTTSFDTFTVTKATTTISAISGTGVYGSAVSLTATSSVHAALIQVNFAIGAATAIGFTDANGVATATINFASLPAALRNAGTYPTGVSVTIGNTGNYTAASATGALTITPKAITVNAATKTKVYGAADPALTFTAVGLVGSDVLSGALSRNSGENVVGSPYAILQGTVTNANNPNYNITYNGANLSITPKAITVTATANSKIYGNPDPVFAYTAVGLVGPDVLSGLLTRTAGENVAGSPYAILQGTVTNANNTNYTITYTGANFTINKRPVTVTADAQTKTYGDADPSLTYVATNLAGSDVLSGSLTRTGGEAVAGSPYAILQGTVTNANNNNYSISYTGANLTISPKAITVTADAQTKTYGDADPTLTYVAGGLVGSDTLSGSLTRDAGESVAGSPYAILQGSVTDANNTNYNITYTGANLTITTKSITVTADAQTKTYGDADPTLTYVAVGLVGTDTLSGSLTRDPGETVVGSPYAILQGSVIDANNTNYSITYTGANLSITTKAITVTADAQTKTYGDAEPSLTYVAVGLVGSDTLTGSLTRDAGETVAGGPYAILQGTLTDANNTNYSITYTGANLTITAKAITVTADAKSKTYGDADPGLTFVANGLVGSDTLAGALTRNAGETVAGSPYAILQGTVTNANNTNYSITYTGANLTITTKAITVTADAKTKVYGAADPAFTYVAVGLVGTDTLTGALTRTAGETVAGSPYPILQGTVTNANNTNYSITYTGANLSVTPKAITVKADAKTKVFGAADPALTYVAVGLVGSDTLSGSLTRTAGESVAGSPYAILQGTVTNANNTNYNITYTGANLTITILGVTASVTANPASVQYSDVVTLCATITGGAPPMTGLPQAAQTVTFKIGTQVVATNIPLVVSGSNLKATYTGALLEPVSTGQMAPGSRVVTAVLNNPDANYAINPLQPTTTLNITAEDASVEYSGLSYFSTSSASSCTANVTLSATLTDAADGNRGDIRNARVTFHSGSIAGPVLGTPNLQPVPVIPDNNTVGTVSVSFPYTLSSSDCADKGTTFTVYAVVTNYYIGNNNSDPGSITVSVPGNDAVTGGGHLVMSNSIGTYAGTPGAKTNFGFTMKYNKNGSNAKGQCNIIIRSNNKVYQVKSTAINSLSTNGQYGSFSTKANLTDVTNPANPIGLGGNLDLLVDMYDFSNGGQNDEVSFSLKNGATILYMSYWTGTQNIRRVLNGGNIQVRNGIAGSSKEAIQPDPIVSYPLEVRVSPNPTASQFGLELRNANTEKVTVRVLDLSGKTVLEENFLSDQQINFGDRLPSATYFIEVSSGEQRKTVRAIKQ